MTLPRRPPLAARRPPPHNPPMDHASDNESLPALLPVDPHADAATRAALVRPPLRPLSAEIDDDAKAAILHAAAITGRPRAAAAALGYSPGALDRAQAADELWSADLRAAASVYVESVLERAADERAVEGWLEPVYQRGELAGEIRRFDSTLLIKRLEALAPERYRQRSSVDLSVRAAGVLVVPGASATDAGSSAADAWASAKERDAG